MIDTAYLKLTRDMLGEAIEKLESINSNSTPVESELPGGEQALLDVARRAVSDANWTIGRVYEEWCRSHAGDRDMDAFAELLDMSEKAVSQRVTIYQRFGWMRSDYPELLWHHFQAMAAYPTARVAECLNWARDTGATVGEMILWRNCQDEPEWKGSK